MKLSWETTLFYLSNHPRWFEDFTRRAPSSEHLREFHAVMPDGWRLAHRGNWLIAEPPGVPLIGEGWKLHVSAASATSVETLRRALPVLREAAVRFKFLPDPTAVRLANGKSYPRTASGKFITVYPGDEAEFHALARGLTEALDGLDGPYVLSDRRVPGSKVVSYRYGGFRSRYRLHPLGIRDLMLEAPDGSLVPDRRTPYWTVPDWAEDPFGPAAAGAEGGGDGLMGGRFTVESALHFSNRGGIYLGTDRETGDRVVLREARPGVEVGPHGVDAIELLRHEYELLTELADTGLFVRPIAHFTAWEHAFIAEEYVEGTHFGHLSITDNPLYSLDLTPDRLTGYYERFRALWLQIADAVELCHRRGIVLGDLSPTNILVDGEDRIRIIDLESAFREDAPPGAARGAGLSTPGMVTRRALVARAGDRRTDYYALGGLMLCTVLACHQNDQVDHAVPLALLDRLASDLALPAELTELIRELYQEDAALPAPAELRRRIAGLPLDTAWRQAPPLALPPAPGSTAPDLPERIADTLDGIVDYLRGTAELQRQDRLFPADLMVFETNPLSLAHGAYGCLYALHTLGRRVPEAYLGWALGRSTGYEAMPPGLYHGTAGVAWAQSALGHRELAARTLRTAGGHPLLLAEPGVLTGAAGHAMACLRLWRDTGRSEFLHRAKELGAHLARTAVRTEAVEAPHGHAHWADSTGSVPVGYGHGAAGVAMFLLALHAATGDPDTLALGRAALDHDLATAELAPTGLLSFPAAVAEDDRPSSVLRQYWDEGTAGILTTLLRYHHVTGDERLRKQIDLLLPDVRRAYTAFPQLFHGTAGLGSALLDAYEFLGDPELLAEAERAAETVLCCAVRRPEGIVFPGEQTLRESADLATGSAGIALFLHRVHRARPGQRTNPNFLLDDLLTTPGER